MLIPSHRHTEADLRLWQEYEAADAAMGRRLSLAKRASAALQAIEKFAASPCYCAVSWGKDSVVVADLVCRASRAFNLRIPLVWVRVEPIANPDCESVRDAFLNIHDVPYQEIIEWCERDNDGWHATGTLSRGFKHAPCGRYISGIRADESGTRTLLARTSGISTANTCRPLTWWSAADVFAYLAAKELPVHPAYAMTGGGRFPREGLRVASLGGRRGDGMGRTEWEREYYGDVLRRLESHQ